MTKRLCAMESLNDVLLEVTDKALRQVFREAGAEVIYETLENNFHLKREQISEKPEIFSSSLRRLLGSGAIAIEKLILKKLHSKLELRFVEKGDYEFSDYIDELRKRFRE